jgi:heptosyltransferase-2
VTKIIITYLTGIGNTLLFFSTLRLLKKHFPQSYIAAIVRYEANKLVLETTGYLDEVIVLNPSTPKGLFPKLSIIRQLRKKRFDISFTPFTLNRLGFNLMSFLIGAKKRIACRYAVGFYQTLGFLQTDPVKAVVGEHEIDQNLRLLMPLKINYKKEDRILFLDIPDEDRRFADEFFTQKNLTKVGLTIGFHPGSTSKGGDLLRRWPTERYAELGRELIDRYNAKVLIFGSRNELPLMEEINNRMDGKAFLIHDTTILQSSALLNKCHLLIANDSGLVHIAVATGIPSISIWGPSDHIRAGHPSEKHTIVRMGLDCSPCKKYPHFQYKGSVKFDCYKKGDKYGECMTSITAMDIIKTIETKYAYLL